MHSALTDREVAEFYSQIEAEAIGLSAEREPQEVYAGDVVYTASNGWRLTVFNDANEYDYVAEVRSSDGRARTFESLDGTPADWQPDDETAWRCLGLPGHGRFRCNGCGEQLSAATERRRSVGPPFLCGGDQCLNRRVPPIRTLIQVRIRPS